MPESSCLLYSTHPDAAQAETTARMLLAEALVACCNLLPGMQSFYHWQGNVAQASECVLISKTTAAKAGAAMARIALLHPYDCPAILQLPVASGHEPYLAWLNGLVHPE